MFAEIHIENVKTKGTQLQECPLEKDFKIKAILKDFAFAANRRQELHSVPANIHLENSQKGFDL